MKKKPNRRKRLINRKKKKCEIKMKLKTGLYKNQLLPVLKSEENILIHTSVPIRERKRLDKTGKDQPNLHIVDTYNCETDHSLSSNFIESKWRNVAENKRKEFQKKCSLNPEQNHYEVRSKTAVQSRNEPLLGVTNPQSYSAHWEILKSIIKKQDSSIAGQSTINHHEVEGTCKEKEFTEAQTESEESSTETSQGSCKTKLTVQNRCIVRDHHLRQSRTAAKDKNKGKLNELDLHSISPLFNDDNLNGKKIGIVALDCEMVGGGMYGEEDILARVSVVDHDGHVLCDKYVKSRERVKDFRTPVSGIRPSNIKDGDDFAAVQKEVYDLLKDRIVVGHALSNDFRCLMVTPPRYLVRDTSKHKPFIRLFNGKTPSLKKLTEKVLGTEIQKGEHNSVEDAQAAMKLYMLHRKEFEEKYRKLFARKKFGLRNKAKSAAVLAVEKH